MIEIICQHCHKAINPILLSDAETRFGNTRTKYHPGCRRKAAALRKKQQNTHKKRID